MPPEYAALVGVDGGTHEPAAHRKVTERDATYLWNNTNELRYELHLTDGRRMGEIRYRLEPEAVALVYLDIDPEFERRGFGTRLVGAALRDLRGRGKAVIPISPLVGDYIRRHPEYADIVVADPAVPERPASPPPLEHALLGGELVPTR
jgi:predicted GNAT family acetyltransferase